MPIIVGGVRPFKHDICAANGPPPFPAQRFPPIAAHSASAVTASTMMFN